MGQSPVLKLSTGYGWREEAFGLTPRRKAASRRMTCATAAVVPRSTCGTTELPGKGFSIQKALRHGVRNLHELHVSADEFALFDLGAPSLGPATGPRNRHTLTGDCNPVPLPMAAAGCPIRAGEVRTPSAIDERE